MKGIKPLGENKILIGQRTEDPDPKAVTVAKMDPIFEGNCPLWTYVLAEATPHKHIDFAGEHLAEDQGVMEGAVDTGHEAAHAILKRNTDDVVLQIE